MYFSSTNLPTSTAPAPSVSPPPSPEVVSPPKKKIASKMAALDAKTFALAIPIVALFLAIPFLAILRG